MKRLLPFIPIFLLIFLNACENNLPEFTPTQWTAIAQTQTATLWTPTWTPTLDPSENKIVVWLNNELVRVDPLEQTLDARYQVLDASFPVAPGASFPNFRIDLRCECAYTSNCCIPERMFVEIVKAMAPVIENITKEVPINVSDIKIVCYDHGAQIGVIGAHWSDVTSYFTTQINGYQLGGRVFHTTIP